MGRVCVGWLAVVIEEERCYRCLMRNLGRIVALTVMFTVHEQIAGNIPSPWHNILRIQHSHIHLKHHDDPHQIVAARDH